MRAKRAQPSLKAVHTNRIGSFHWLCAARWFTDSSNVLRSHPELVLHVFFQTRHHKGVARNQARGHPLVAVAIFLNQLDNVALNGTAAIVVWSLPGDRDGLGRWVASLHLERRVWFFCEVKGNTQLMSKYVVANQEQSVSNLYNYDRRCFNIPLDEPEGQCRCGIKEAHTWTLWSSTVAVIMLRFNCSQDD